jgi:hypothetical protein
MQKIHILGIALSTLLLLSAHAQAQTRYSKAGLVLPMLDYGVFPTREYLVGVGFEGEHGPCLKYKSDIDTVGVCTETPDSKSVALNWYPRTDQRQRIIDPILSSLLSRAETLEISDTDSIVLHFTETNSFQDGKVIRLRKKLEIGFDGKLTAMEIIATMIKDATPAR